MLSFSTQQLSCWFLTSRLCSSIMQLNHEILSKANTWGLMKPTVVKPKKVTNTLYCLNVGNIPLVLLSPCLHIHSNILCKSLRVSYPWSDLHRAHAAKTYIVIKRPHRGTWSVLNIILNPLNMSVLKRLAKCCQEHGVKTNVDEWMYVFLCCGICVSWNRTREIKVFGDLK